MKKKIMNEDICNMKIKALMLVLCIIILQGCGDTSTQYKLLASIQSTNQHIIVENGDVFVWENAKITINDEYTYETEYVPRGKTSVPYSLFTNAGGEVYQPGLLKVRNVEIIVPKFDGEKDAVFSW
ncbi:hypothetical protein [Chengkuizengella axinellae]|uniref:DUF3221 domain-containing protein n=1 Tax=Chengkuizengella axinellae TaxID=3064388 RepID=A0ABT9J5X1_9BACL|nr:hypothetical protein [Chengkuizengella sp. 2205SS18-9]MDP5277006.1 hypothetical protein [Chengkuizengella sp. 2205SS18-9]